MKMIYKIYFIQKEMYELSQALKDYKSAGNKAMSLFTVNQLKNKESEMYYMAGRYLKTKNRQRINDWLQKNKIIPQ